MKTTPETLKRQAALTAEIKQIVTDMVYNSDKQIGEKHSEFISKRMGLNYVYLTNVFSLVEGKTIIRQIQETKIKRVKELLDSGMTLVEISFKLDYCNLPHLSNQFRKICGCTPTQYKRKIAA